MILFNAPIFILVSIFVNRRLGLLLLLYMAVQSFSAELCEILSLPPYSLANNKEDFEIVFECIATGVISGLDDLRYNQKLGFMFSNGTTQRTQISNYLEQESPQNY